MAPTREQRQQWGRIGGLTVAATHDTKAVTAPARRAFLARFENQVDPDRQLPADERARRAEAAKRAYMLSLAQRSAASRRRAS